MISLGCVRVLVVALPVALAVPPRAASAQETEQAGKPQYKLEYSGISLYRTYCSTCHGREGQGDGPMADQLRYRPPDLTLLAQRNNGKYPADDVFRMIDGRKPLKGHGGPDMPIWGDAFKNAREGFDEASVKDKIQAIVDYLAGIQSREK
jgi:mono/diheme cytochrome c family protein